MRKLYMKNKKKQIIIITGPTAIGKTGLAVFLAKTLAIEILSFDSRQFYKEMMIGTAVPSKEEMQTIPHHFIHNLSIHDDYSVGDYERDALEKITELFQKYDQLILVGGSGLFEKAVTEGLDKFPQVDKKIRQELNAAFEQSGIKPLQDELKNADPTYYQEVDEQNPKRIIRALEICRGTGKPFSTFRKNNTIERNFEIIKIGLELPREEIYNRINQRVDLMIKDGLLEEAKKLYPYKHLNSLQTVGYKELFDFLDGEIDLDTAIDEIKKNTRRYAKRQLTWNRKDKSIHWFSPGEKQEILQFLTLNLQL